MKNKGMVYSFVVMLLWGLLFPTVKLGYQVFGIQSTGDILTFAGFRFIVCGLLIVLFSLARNPQSFHALKRHWLPVLASGLFAIILHYGFTYVGLNMTDGSKTAILKQLGAAFYICFAPLFFPNEKLTSRKILGLLLGLCGIVAINANAGGITFHIGDLLIIAASFCTVFSNVISKKVFTHVEPIVSTGVSQLFGGMILTGVGIGSRGNLVTIVPKTSGQYLVFGMIVAASTVSYCLWFLIVQKESLSKLFIIKFTEPLFAALFSWILLGEDIFNINYMVAFVLISVGIIVENSSPEGYTK